MKKIITEARSLKRLERVAMRWYRHYGGKRSGALIHQRWSTAFDADRRLWTACAAHAKLGKKKGHGR